MTSSAPVRARSLFSSRLSLLPENIARWYQVGKPIFNTIGKTYLELLKDRCSLKPGDTVFDLGCGIGRISIEFVDYLWPDGNYVGVDIVPEAVQWARGSFEPLGERFTFHHADIRNAEYNPKGAIDATDYRFPVESESVDVVLATSLFTHIRRADTRHYFSQVARALKPGGRALMTFFVINPDSLTGIESGASILPFQALDDGSYTATPARPETAVAHQEDWLVEALQHAGLNIAGDIEYGAWFGRKSTRGQDLIVAEKQ